MTANDVIESYVDEVAVRLPRRQRNDVAFELRALLGEELQARADAAGRGADSAMATELLRAFGRPTDVAARYRPTLTIVDPSDGHSFLRATVVGLALIWSVGLVVCLQQPVDAGSGLLGALGQWWGGTVVPSLWWPGVLVAGFGSAAWARRRWPRASTWTPRPDDRIRGSRATMALGLVGIVCGVVVLGDPPWLLDVFFGGRAAPAAYDALTYAETFTRRQAPCLLVLLLLNIPMLAVVMVNGRWAGGMRRVDISLRLAMCAALAWTVLDGPVFVALASDRAAKTAMVLIVAITLIDLAVRMLRKVRPAPGKPSRA